jgi:aspartyl-tRNA(Asn)/glutamyl-tRNA(Gln) amidotransferase subunit C
MATPEDVKKLAALARLEIPEESLDAFTKEFDGVLSYVGTLEELALAHETPSAGVVRNVFREDAEPHASGLHTEKLVTQFPKREGNHLAVKKIISYD